jgi:hypothetical protein
VDNALESDSWETVYDEVRRIIEASVMTYSSNEYIKYMVASLPFGVSVSRGIKTVDTSNDTFADSAEFQIGMLEGNRVQRISLKLGKALYNNFPKKSVFDYKIGKGGILYLNINVYTDKQIKLRQFIRLFVTEARGLLMYHCE